MHFIETGIPLKVGYYYSITGDGQIFESADANVWIPVFEIKPPSYFARVCNVNTFIQPQSVNSVNEIKQTIMLSQSIREKIKEALIEANRAGTNLDQDLHGISSRLEVAIETEHSKGTLIEKEQYVPKGVLNARDVTNDPIKK